MSNRRPKLKKLSCDQVSELMSAFRRLLEFTTGYASEHAKRSKAAKLATLLEIMDILGYEFEDSAAAGNALAAFWEFNELRMHANESEVTH